MPRRGDGVLSVCANLGYDGAHWNDRPTSLRLSVETFRKTYALKHSLSLISDDMRDATSACVQKMAMTFLEHGLPEENSAAGKSFWEKPRGTKKLVYPKHKKIILNGVADLLVAQNRNLHRNRHKVNKAPWIETDSEASERSQTEDSLTEDTQESSQAKSSQSRSATRRVETRSLSTAKSNPPTQEIVRSESTVSSLVDATRAWEHFHTCLDFLSLPERCKLDAALASFPKEHCLLLPSSGSTSKGKEAMHHAQEFAFSHGYKVDVVSTALREYIICRHSLLYHQCSVDDPRSCDEQSEHCPFQVSIDFQENQRSWTYQALQERHNHLPQLNRGYVDSLTKYCSQDERSDQITTIQVDRLGADCATSMDSEPNLLMQSHVAGDQMLIEGIQSTPDRAAISAELSRTDDRKRKSREDSTARKRLRTSSPEIQSVSIRIPPRCTYPPQPSYRSGSDENESDSDENESDSDENESDSESDRRSPTDDHDVGVSSNERRDLSRTAGEMDAPADDSSVVLMDEDVRPRALRFRTRSNEPTVAQSSSADLNQRVARSALEALHSPKLSPSSAKIAPINEPISDLRSVPTILSRLNSPEFFVEQSPHLIEDPEKSPIGSMPNEPAQPTTDVETATVSQDVDQACFDSIVTSLEGENFRSDEMDESDITLEIPGVLQPIGFFLKARTVPPAFPDPPSTIPGPVSGDIVAELRSHRFATETAHEDRVREKSIVKQQSTERSNELRTPSQEAATHERPIQTPDMRDATAQVDSTPSDVVQKAHVDPETLDDPPPLTTPVQEATMQDAPSTRDVQVLLIHPTGAKRSNWRGKNPLSDDVPIEDVFATAEKMLRFQSIATLTMTLSILELPSKRELFSYDSFVDKGDQARFDMEKEEFGTWAAERLDELEEEGRGDNLRLRLALQPDAEGIVEGAAQIDVGRASKARIRW